MTSAFVPTEPRPVAEMNMTPLIDVLLVLLVMFVITVPLQTHAVKVDLPSRPLPMLIDPVKNTIHVTRAGVVLWNGNPVSDSGLRDRLQHTVRLPSEPELHIRPDAEAPYRVVDEVLAATKRAGATKLGFVGNEAFQRSF